MKRDFVQEKGGVVSAFKLGVVLLLFAVAAVHGAPFHRTRPAIANTSEHAIRKGLEFLLRDRSDLSALIVLDYLQRKYALPTEYTFERTYDGLNEVEKLRTWGRFVGRATSVHETALGSLEDAGIEELVMHALFCDRFRLPDSYGSLLGRFVDKGGYELTHAVLAFKLARDRGCELDAAATADLELQMARALHALIQRPPPDPRFEELDVRYEALAVLLDFLGEPSPPRGALEKVLAEQQLDGGFKPAADQSSRPHPTVMAVWALLAHARKGNAVTPFARAEP